LANCGVYQKIRTKISKRGGEKRTPYFMLYGRPYSLQPLDAPFGCAVIVGNATVTYKRSLVAFDGIYLGRDSESYFANVYVFETDEVIKTATLRFDHDKIWPATSWPSTYTNPEDPRITHFDSDSLSYTASKSRPRRKPVQTLADMKAISRGRDPVMDIPGDHTAETMVAKAATSIRDQARKKELDAFEKNGVWHVEKNLPAGVNVLPTFFFEKIKHDAQGQEFVKSRLVVDGSKSKEGLDYEETFAPVAFLDSIRIVFAIAAQRQMQLAQVDVETAFLHAPIDRDVYVYAPKELCLPRGTVMKLDKDVYGLKQGPLLWNRELDSTLKSAGFKRLKSEESLYVKKVRGDEKMVILAVYVDDILIAADTQQLVDETKQILKSKYPVKDLGTPRKLLGVTITGSPRDGWTWDLQDYITSRLARYGILESSVRLTPTPLWDRAQIVEEGHGDDEPCSQSQKCLYQSMVGTLAYIERCCRPDISYVVHLLSRVASNPTQAHIAFARRVWYYLREYPDLGLSFKPGADLRIGAWSDASLAGLPDKKSVLGYVIYVGSSLVAWKAKKTSHVAPSSQEVEYLAMHLAVRKIEHVVVVLGEILSQVDKPMLGVDNMPALQVATSKAGVQSIGHMATKVYHVRDMYPKSIQYYYCDTASMKADGLTKPLPRYKFQRFLSLLGLLSVRTSVQEKRGRVET